MNNSSYNYTPIGSTIPCEQNSQYENMVNNSQSFQPDPNCQGDECKPIAYYKMSVSYEIEGGFTNYVNFRNIIANKPKIVNIENEEIKKNENISGLIKATATVSLVKNREMNWIMKIKILIVLSVLISFLNFAYAEDPFSRSFSTPSTVTGDLTLTDDGSESGSPHDEI